MLISRDRSKKRLLVGRVAVVLALVVGLSAAGGSASAAAAPAAQSDFGSQYVAFIKALSAVAKENETNCAKMANALKTFISSHKAFITSLEAQAKHLSKAQKAAFALKYRGQIAAAIRTFAEDVLSCSTNKQVQAALATLKSIKA